MVAALSSGGGKPDRLRRLDDQVTLEGAGSNALGPFLRVFPNIGEPGDPSMDCSGFVTVRMLKSIETGSL